MHITQNRSNKVTNIKTKNIIKIKKKKQKHSASLLSACTYVWAYILFVDLACQVRSYWAQREDPPATPNPAETATTAQSAPYTLR